MNHRTVYLESDKLQLSPATREDFGAKMEGWINDKEVTQFLSRGTFPAQAETLQKEFDASRSQQSDLQFAIIDKATGTYIGVAGLHSINWLSRHAEFRILIGEKTYWGKGYGAETCQLLSAYAFEGLNLNKVWLGVNTGNSRAFESYKRCGFQPEGVLRDELFRNNKFHDIARMSLLRTEYNNLKPKWSVYKWIQKTFYV